MRKIPLSDRANGVANSVDSVAIMVVSAVNLAMVTVVGQCMGAGEPEQARRYAKKLMGISYISTAVLGGLVCLLLPAILSMYQLSDETYRLACILIIMHNVLAFLLLPTAFYLPNSLRAAGDVKITMAAGIFSMVVFRLGTAVLLGLVCVWGIIGVWAVMGMDWLARSVIFVIRYRSNKWQSIRVI